MAFLDNNGVARLVADLKGKLAEIVHTHAASDITSGTLGVARGGTGKATHTSNAVITGNGTSAVNNVATADGALYATAVNGAAQFGTLPVAQGGTAGTTEAEARENLEVPVNAAIATVESATATANHAIGDHFMLDDKLKTATAAIATGETINATNSADDTVQSQIDTLRDSVDPLFSSYSSRRESAYNLNELTESGTYFCQNGSAHKPGTQGGGLLVIRGLTNAMQFMVCYDNKAWIRLYADPATGGSGWTTWTALN